jgi:hypothetical protein
VDNDSVFSLIILVKKDGSSGKRAWVGEAESYREEVGAYKMAETNNLSELNNDHKDV